VVGEVADVLTTFGVMDVDIAETVSSSNLAAIRTTHAFGDFTISSMLFKEVDFLKRSGIMDMDFTLFVTNPELVRLLGPSHEGGIVGALPLIDLG